VGEYPIAAALEIGVSHHGRRLVEVNQARRDLAAVVQDALNDLLARDAGLRDALWRAAGGGDDVDGAMTFSVVDVQAE